MYLEGHNFRGFGKIVFIRNSVNKEIRRRSIPLSSSTRHLLTFYQCKIRSSTTFKIRRLFRFLCRFLRVSTISASRSNVKTNGKDRINIRRVSNCHHGTQHTRTTKINIRRLFSFKTCLRKSSNRVEGLRTNFSKSKANARASIPRSTTTIRFRYLRNRRTSKDLNCRTNTSIGVYGLFVKSTRKAS